MGRRDVNDDERLAIVAAYLLRNDGWKLRYDKKARAYLLTIGFDALDGAIAWGDKHCKGSGPSRALAYEQAELDLDLPPPAGQGM